MGSGYLGIKSFHIVFVANWFAGLGRLPRLFVNPAMVALTALPSAKGCR